MHILRLYIEYMHDKNYAVISKRLRYKEKIFVFGDLLVFATFDQEQHQGHVIIKYLRNIRLIID